MNLQDAKNYLHKWGINQDTTIFDNMDRGHQLDCLLEMYYEEKLKLCNKPAVINCVAVPEWLTPSVRVVAKYVWNEHRNHNDNKRVEAMRIVQKCAEDAGYKIDIKKAVEILKQNCL